MREIERERERGDLGNTVFLFMGDREGSELVSSSGSSVLLLGSTSQLGLVHG